MLARWLPFESNEASVNTCQAQAHETPARAPTKRAIKKHYLNTCGRRCGLHWLFMAFKIFAAFYSFFSFHWVIFKKTSRSSLHRLYGARQPSVVRCARRMLFPLAQTQSRSRFLESAPWPQLPPFMTSHSHTSTAMPTAPHGCCRVFCPGGNFRSKIRVGSKVGNS